MNIALDDTIVAPASPAGGAARGIVRVSGVGAIRCVARFFIATAEHDWTVRNAARVVSGRLNLYPRGASAPTCLPCELYVWPNERSYTRAPTVEIHTLGSPPLLRLVVESLCASGARLAQPGEFTWRAFLAGRIDLTQAEAVLGVIDATGGEDLQVALAQLAGGMSGPLDSLRNILLDLLADLEAGLDFAEEDIRFLDPHVLRARLNEAEQQIADLTAKLSRRSVSGELPRVVLIGRPNVGKSSLFNALARGSAIVSDVPGTTRDFLAATIDLGGVAVQLVDTAGVQEADSGVAGAAQCMTAQQQQQAHVQLYCQEASRSLADLELAGPQHAAQAAIIVLTKCDLAGCSSALDEPNHSLPVIATSAATGAGLDELRGKLRAAAMESTRAGVVSSTAERCGESLRRAGDHLRRAEELCGHADEIVAAELRGALSELGQVVGAVYTDDVLDRIFSRFCIGK